jgi:cysteine synthase A
LIWDGGERYGHSYYDDAWVRQQGMDLEPYRRAIEIFLTSGRWAPPA